MSAQRQLLVDSVERLFGAHAQAAAKAQLGEWPQQLWQETVELGMPSLLVPVASGGMGADWDDVCAVLSCSGSWHVPLPIAETILAARLASGANLPVPTAAVSIAVSSSGKLSRRGAQYSYSGSLVGVPWGRDVDAVLTTARQRGALHVVMIERSRATVRTGANLAGEPRDELVLEGSAVQAAATSDPFAAQLFEAATLARCAQIAGALHAALSRSLQFAGERRQFGRAIGQFQVIQHQLAIMGMEVAAVACAVRAAAAEVEGGSLLAVAAAKLRANQAIGAVTAIAHQIHGAMGFTQACGLHHLSQRLWSWRSEYGNDRYWSERLGQRVIDLGARNFWHELASQRPRN